MITKTIEFFTITIDNNAEPYIDKDVFDTFDEARSHISDKNENGKYKYSTGWIDRQDCNIRRYFCCPGMHKLSKTDQWHYSEGKLVQHYNWDKENPYTGNVW